MSNFKKIIGVVLALVMALSVATVAFAAPADNYTVTLVADKTELQAGETATVDVKLTTNFKVSAITIPVFFDNTKVTVTGVATATDATEIANTTVVFKESPTNSDVSRFYKGTSYTPADHGVIALSYIAQVGNAVRPYTNETVMKLTVTALEGVSGAAVVECLSETVKTNARPSGTLLVGKNPTADSNVVDAVPEIIDNGDVTGATTTINIAGLAADPELVLTATGSDYGTVIRTDLCTTDYAGCVFGIDTLNGESIEDYVTANNGSIEVLPNEESGAITTGATILLKNNAGETVATYVFIYFGDVNGDGAVDGTDAVAVESHDGWVEMFTEDTAYYYSADVNYDGAVDGTDAVAIEAHDGWVEMLEDQNVIAAAFNTVY